MRIHINMQVLFYLYFIAVLVCVKCDQNCDHLGTIVYEDLGCRPVKEDGKDCPVKFECDDFSNDNTTCLFRGVRYNASQEVDENLTYENCYAACRCYDPSGDEKYMCAVLDCPEWLGSGIEKGCYRKYEVDKCCSTGTLCPHKQKLEECEYDGNVYREGDIFYPKRTCLKCACGKGFKGKIEEPFCKRNMCAVQIHNSDKLANYCAPAYYHFREEESLCCPDDWICESENDKITKVNPKAESNSNLSCNFGSRVLKLGEGFEREVDYYGTERNVICECILPPFLTCKEKIESH